MSEMVQRVLPPMEVNSSHREPDRSCEAVKKLHDVPLRQAKAAIGGAVREAIGARPLKEFGHEGLLSEVCSGGKAPEYLARIYLDPQARRRFALALLAEDADVTVTTTVTIPQKKRSA